MKYLLKHVLCLRIFRTALVRFCMYKIHICICKYTPGLSRCIFTRGCIFAHVQIYFYIYAIAFTCPQLHPGANYTYMYNIHPVCKSAHVNGALECIHIDLSFFQLVRWEKSSVNFIECMVIYPFILIILFQAYV